MAPCAPPVAGTVTTDRPLLMHHYYTTISDNAAPVSCKTGIAATHAAYPSFRAVSTAPPALAATPRILASSSPHNARLHREKGKGEGGIAPTPSVAAPLTAHPAL